MEAVAEEDLNRSQSTKLDLIEAITTMPLAKEQLVDAVRDEGITTISRWGGYGGRV